MHRSFTHWWCGVRLQAGRYRRSAMSLPVGSMASMMGAAYSSRPAGQHSSTTVSYNPLVPLAMLPKHNACNAAHAQHSTLHAAVTDRSSRLASSTLCCSVKVST